MSNKIQHANLRKNARRRTTLAFFGILIMVSLIIFTIFSINAYLSYSTNRKGEINFGAIEVSLLSTSGTEISASNFKNQYLTNFYPGSTLVFDDIQVKNTGDFEAYVLINLDVEIVSVDNLKSLHYNEWYNIEGNKIDESNITDNAVKPNLLAVEESLTTNLSWTIPIDDVNNNYKDGILNVSISAYGLQTNIDEASAYVDKELYVTYHIIKNAQEIASFSGLEYNGAVPTGEPKRKNDIT